jgi:hypothetical protein
MEDLKDVNLEEVCKDQSRCEKVMSSMSPETVKEKAGDLKGICEGKKSGEVIKGLKDEKTKEAWGKVCKSNMMLYIIIAVVVVIVIIGIAAFFFLK